MRKRRFSSILPFVLVLVFAVAAIAALSRELQPQDICSIQRWDDHGLGKLSDDRHHRAVFNRRTIIEQQLHYLRRLLATERI